MRTLRLLCVAIALSVSVLPGKAVAQTGTIAGTLIDETTALPIVVGTASFVVALYSADGEPFKFANVETNAHYSFTSVPPGTYFLKTSAAPGYVKELHDNLACIAADCVVTSGTPVVIAAGTNATIDFVLPREGTITGTVRRAADASPIANVTVDIYNSSTSLVASVETVVDGTYIVRGLTTGSYLARTRLTTDGPVVNTSFDFITELYGGALCPWQAPVSDCRLASGTPIAVTAGATTPGVDFSLDAGATIAGTIVADGTSNPLASRTVGAYVGDRPYGLAATDAMGRYTIRGLPAGSYRVRTTETVDNYVDEWHNGQCLGCPGTVTTIGVAAGAAITGVDFSLATGGTIAGTITCQASSTGFYRPPEIYAYNSAGILIRQTNLGGSSLQCDGTNTTRTYSLTGLPTGSYYLLARDTPVIPSRVSPSGGQYVDQLYGGTVCNTVDCDVRKGTPVAVTAGVTTAAIDFTMQLGAYIAGSLSDVTTPMTVYDARGVEMVGVVAKGGFIQHQDIAGLPPGTYYVTFGNQLHSGITCFDCPPTSGTPMVIAPGTTAGPTLNFGTPPVRQLRGTVTNAAGGAPLSTITVDVLTGSGKVVASAVSDFLGHYTVKNLGAGTFFVRTRNDRGFVDEVFDNQLCASCDPRTGTPVVIGAVSDVGGVDFALAAGGILSGVVTDTVAGALGSVPVSVYLGPTTLAAHVVSSASGRFRTTVPTGSYRALAEATNKNGAEVYAEMPCSSTACDPATGTPIAVTSGATTSNVNFTLTSCSAMTLSPPLLATAVNGTAYRQVFSATGGAGQYSFDVTDGALPLGLTLNATTGVLSGTPTVTGRHAFRVAALASDGCATDRAYTLDVQGCAFILSPSSTTVPAAGGTFTVSITGACGAETVNGLPAWIGVQSSAAGQVTFSALANSGATPRSAALSIGRRVFQVRQAGTASHAPYGVLDLPADGAQVSGAFAVTGWALDDLEVARVLIYRDPVGTEGAGPIFVGTATFIPGARPDVQAAAPSVPFSDRAGFGFMILSYGLPNQGNGTFRIHAIAEDAEGQRTVLGSRTIVGNNTTAQVPFGTIDRPNQGETVAGTEYLNWGWALTPQPGMIATDGSTIRVIVDGASIGTVTYNLFRPDVSTAFPGLANSGGPVGYRAIDTTRLAEGLHTISWTATDNRPATSGLGSRYFTVANSADAQTAGSAPSTRTATADGATTSAADEVSAEAAAQPVGVAAAPDSGRRTASIAPALAADGHDVVIARGDQAPRRLVARDDGTRVVAIAPMERVTLALAAADAGCSGTWAGYLVKSGVLSDLPVGASLDASGTFYWQTGPGFAGRFPLLFVRTDCRGEKQSVSVLVTVQPR